MSEKKEILVAKHDYSTDRWRDASGRFISLKPKPDPKVDKPDQKR